MDIKNLHSSCFGSCTNPDSRISFIDIDYPFEECTICTPLDPVDNEYQSDLYKESQQLIGYLLKYLFMQIFLHL